MAGIQFERVSKSYGARRVLGDLSLSVEDGECFTLLGPSGCGKTVLLRLCAGFEQPDSGQIAIGGRLVSAPGKDVFVKPESRRLGVVFQDYAVWPHLSVFDNVAYPLRVHGVPKHEMDERTLAAIAQVNLAGLEARMPSQLSGGQQQRVALARALAGDPEIMLFDEPLSNLDAHLREEMRFEIKEIQAATGVTILYVTHDQEIALALADRMAIMDETGRIRQIGEPRAVFDEPADAFVFKFMGVANFIPVRREHGRAVLAGDGADTGLAWPDLQDGQAALGLRPSDIELTRGPASATARVTRRTLLGAEIDVRLSMGGVELRARLDTREAMESGLLFEEGESCGLVFHEPKWFAPEAEDVLP